MSATPEQIADWLMIVAVGDAANEYTNRAEHMRAAAALIRAQAETVRVLESALRAAQAALAAYEGAHHQDRGVWSLLGLHDAEALSVDAQAKIDAALRGEA